ncbi:MAG: hypothetical protein JW774_03600 [Candidatus Aureabacteria bacterium]|nr:hypothetical protein [Candidatus Auribacterota bacterium]
MKHNKIKGFIEDLKNPDIELRIATVFALPSLRDSPSGRDLRCIPVQRFRIQQKRLWRFEWEHEIVRLPCNSSDFSILASEF